MYLLQKTPAEKTKNWARKTYFILFYPIPSHSTLLRCINHLLATTPTLSLRGTTTSTLFTDDCGLAGLLYYFDQMFTGCHLSPKALLGWTGSRQSNRFGCRQDRRALMRCRLARSVTLKSHMFCNKNRYWQNLSTCLHLQFRVIGREKLKGRVFSG
jgi:hypothetical protein